VFGIPERAADFLLADTINSNSSNYSEPYRLYNVDVFKYETNQSYLGLYGSVPYLMTHDKESNVALFWNNAAETWIDIYSVNDTNSQMKRGTRWTSETGVMEFVIIMGDNPKDIMSKW
jgi:alpha 1,3-glucosidase